MKLLHLTLAVVVPVALLSGCGPAPAPAPVDVSSLLGESMVTVHDVVPNDSELLVQDVSPRLGLEASYRSDSEQSAWTVVAACADASDIGKARSVEVAVVPLPMTDVEGAMPDRDVFDGAVDCTGRAHGAHL